MIRLIKLFFIIILIISDSRCFAGAKEEELAELTTAIFQPIATHFSELSSFTRYISKQILEQEKTEERSFDKTEADAVRTALVRKVQTTAMTSVCDSLAVSKTKTEVHEEQIIHSEHFADRYLNSWTTKAANCATYARLVLIVFEFNMMNIIAQQKVPLFRTAALVKPYGDTGDHGLVLVEGVSGTIFAVDPWVRKIAVLDDSFTKLSTIHGPIYKLDDNEEVQLNHMFGETYKGKTYYDVLYVNYDTKWLIRKRDYEIIHDIAITKNKQYMEKFYNTLRPSFSTRWVKNYEELFYTFSFPDK